jgi:hypothetical protein
MANWSLTSTSRARWRERLLFARDVLIEIAGALIFWGCAIAVSAWVLWTILAVASWRVM